jgi:hypothetical protein
MGSIKTCLLQEITVWAKNDFLIQEDTLYGVNKDLSDSRKYVILGQ